MNKWIASLFLFLLASQSSFAKAPDLFDSVTGQSTLYLNKVLEIIGYQLPSGHIDVLSELFQKDFFESDAKYFDYKGNFSKFLLKKYPNLHNTQELSSSLRQESEEKAVKMASQALDFMYSSREDTLPEIKSFDHAILISGEVLESISIRCQLVKKALEKGYHFKKIWFYAGNNQTQEMINSEIEKNEFKLIKENTEIHIIVTNTSNYVFDKGIEQTESELIGNVLVIGPQATVTQHLKKLQSKITHSHAYAFSIAEKDWIKDMNSFGYVEKHKNENQATLAWFGSTFNYEIARSTNLLVQQRNKSL